MNDAEFEAQQKRLQGFMDKWVEKLRLNFWEIVYVWARHSGEMREGHENATGTCRAVWTHFQATIHWNLEEFAKLNDTEAERIVLHEHLHILTAETGPSEDEPDALPRRAHWRDHEERLVSMLTQIMLWLDAE